MGNMQSNHTWQRLMILLTALALVAGCAPLPDLEMEDYEDIDAAPALSKAEMDSLTNLYRSFAHEYWKQRNYETAAQYYDSVLTYDYDHKYNVYRALADCCINQQDHDGAIKNYETGINYFPDDAYLRSSLAHMYRNLNRFEEAIDQQLEAIRIKPEEVDYKHTLAEMYIKVENFDNAITTYEELAEMLPDDVVINKKLTDLYMTQRDPEQYLQILKEGVEAFPADGARRIKYASALFDQGSNQMAADEFGKYTAQEPDEMRGWKGLAQANDNLGRFKAAIEAYKHVIKIEPENTEVMVAIGYDYLTLKSWGKVRTWAKRALATNAEAGTGWVLLGEAYQASADIASGDTPDYYDKLVFLIAYGQFKKATASADFDARNAGERGMRFLKGSELIPSKEDRFMNRKKTMPIGEHYKWINHNWAEVKFIDGYLKSLDG